MLGLRFIGLNVPLESRFLMVLPSPFKSPSHGEGVAARQIGCYCGSFRAPDFASWIANPTAMLATNNAGNERTRKPYWLKVNAVRAPPPTKAAITRPPNSSRRQGRGAPRER